MIGGTKLHRDVIRNVRGVVCGYIDTDDKGNKIARDRTGKVLGYYKVVAKATTDSRGKPIAYSDIVSSLIDVK